MRILYYVIAIVVSVGAAFLIVKNIAHDKDAEALNAQCTKIGGLLIKTYNAFVCIEFEKAEPTQGQKQGTSI